MRRIFWAYLTHNQIIITKYKRKCYSTLHPKVYATKQSLDVSYKKFYPILGAIWMSWMLLCAAVRFGDNAREGAMAGVGSCCRRDVCRVPASTFFPRSIRTFWISLMSYLHFVSNISECVPYVLREVKVLTCYDCALFRVKKHNCALWIFLQALYLIAARVAKCFPY